MANCLFKIGDFVRAKQNSSLDDSIKGKRFRITQVSEYGGSLLLDFSSVPGYRYKNTWHHPAAFELSYADDFRLNFNHETNDVESAIAEATRIASLTGIPVKVHHVET